MPSVQVLEYLDPQGRSPYAKWFDGLNVPAAAKVAAALYRLAEGNFSTVKGVGAGVFERKIDQSLSHQYPRDALSPEKSSARRPVKAIVTLLPRRATLQSAFLAATLRDGAIFAHFVVGLLCNIDILLQSFS